MHQFIGNEIEGVPPGSNRPTPDSGSPPLLLVLWRRRWVLALSILVCVLAAIAYLAIAVPVYRATAKLEVDEQSPKVFGEAGPTETTPEFLQTQADLIQSATVLTRALDTFEGRSMQTFQGVADPVGWLRRGNALSVETGRKSNVLLIAIESPQAMEAADIANAIAEAYIVEQSLRSRATGSEMVRVLQKEKEALQRRRDARLEEMLKFKKDHSLLSFGTDKGNTVLERTASLSGSFTAAQIATMELRAQLEAVRAALSSPDSVSAYVQSLQFEGRDLGDREYDELRTQLLQYQLVLASTGTSLGSDHPRVQVLSSTIETLKQRIHAKERLIAEGQLASITAKLAAAEGKERQIQDALQAQSRQALALGPEAARYQVLEAEASRLQQQCDLIESRIAEVSVNSLEAAPLHVRVLDPAVAEPRPVKPRKALTLAAALLAGLVLGMGLALLSEWHDARLYTPDEISPALGIPVLAVVPRMNARLTPAARGQLVHVDPRCPVAEAFRSARTSLQLGEGKDARTILVASPMPGDGKSTTASNLATAFAHNRHRTLLIDCDLREPVQHLIFGVDGSRGLVGVLKGEQRLSEALRSTDVPGLYVLPCGEIPSNPSELLASQAFSHLVAQLADTFDRIVFDSPPLMSVTDGRILAASADATVLVLRMSRAMRRLGVLAVEGLEEVGANVRGAIANDVPAPAERSYFGRSWQYATSARRLLGTVVRPARALPATSAPERHDDGLPEDPEEELARTAP